MRVSLQATCELEPIAALEQASYPADEAASPERLAIRLKEAPEYFRTIHVDGTFAGFICGTKCKEFNAESLTKHEDGPILAIHSVVVEPAYRRKGVAKRALRLYCDQVVARGDLLTIKLIAKAGLLPLYRKVGFQVVGLSNIVHGSDAWFECELDTRPDMLQIDAFTSRLYGGNPAAVVFIQGTDEWMAKCAVENNLSETAFLQCMGANHFSIRWFTPKAEVDLCGHATLAAAKALFDTGRADSPLTLSTRNAGDLIVEQGGDSWLSLDMPSATLTECQVKLPFPYVYCAQGPKTVPDLFVEVTPDTFTNFKIDPSVILQIPEVGRGLIVTCAGKEVDFMSRFFAPKHGINEDPVTGSAHTLLTPYWEKKLQKTPLRAFQASERGGDLRVFTQGERTIVQGQGVTVLAAKLL